MYSASSDFHHAVANGAEQMALLIFDDAVFTNADIDVQRGIEFKDCFNMSEDLSIGQALSNELTFSIFNDNRLLNSYEFGEFTATIGVQIAEGVHDGTVYAESADHTYSGSGNAPYLLRDDAPVPVQPDYPVTSILVYNGIVYCGLTDGSVVGYNDGDGSATSVNVNAFMLDKFSRWHGKGISYDKTTRILNIWDGSSVKTYEFVPLGRFIAERPKVPDEIEIDFVCNDLMMKFENDMPTAAEMGITYPITIGAFFAKLCQMAGVSYQTNVFINSTATIDEDPEEFRNVTMREVLQWIAELAASNARFNRDGLLVFDWIRATGQEMDENDYSVFRPYWYETQQITKLYNRASNGEYEYTQGTGAEGYLIQDNPLLKGVQ